MSQKGIDVIPLLMEDGLGSNSVFTESDQSREGMSCGLDVEPEVASLEGQKQKANMKKLQLAILAACLAAAMSASASITYSGTGLDGLDYSSKYSGDAQYVPASGLTPAYAALYTADASTASTADSPTVFVRPPTGTTLSTLSGSYDLSSVLGSGTSVQPYWALWVGTGSTYKAVLYSLGGTPLTSSSTMHAFYPDFSSSLGTWGDTLSQFDAITIGGVALGDMTVYWVGLEIGDGGPAAPASANIGSITVVPEPTTMIAGALLLLPFGASTLRMLRKTRTA